MAFFFSIRLLKILHNQSSNHHHYRHIMSYWVSLSIAIQRSSIALVASSQQKRWDVMKVTNYYEKATKANEKHSNIMCITGMNSPQTSSNSLRDVCCELQRFNNAYWQNQLQSSARLLSSEWIAVHRWFGHYLHRYPSRQILAATWAVCERTVSNFSWR